ncbi:MAG: DMT family transporter [Ruminococcaceae bacterium]|nr:DMT family transporter [Oscillospiraceae bacterium]
MWFWFAIIAFVCWSGSDIFSKIGCADSRDKYSHYKMVTAVGVIMGLHAAYEIFIAGVEINAKVILTYLPVSALYILSMAIGYIGLRYIELSISSPICNTSGAIVAVLCIITGSTLEIPQYIAVALVCIGVILLGFVEAREDETLRARRQEKGNYKYAKSALALILPLVYCLLDALGTFADSLVLYDEEEPAATTFRLLFWHGDKLGEDSANVAYELTFLLCGIAAFIYVKLIKKQKFLPKMEAPKYTGAVFETIGQFFYISALADSKHVAMAAPIISSYCLLSALWGRIFLKEKLSWKHYASIAIAFVGIVILGIYDP